MSEFHRKCEQFMKFVKEPYDKRKRREPKPSAYAYYDKCCIRSGIYEGRILYESSLGQQMEGNPYILFLEIINRKEFIEYQHIWSVDSEEKKESLQEEWKECSNVSFVIRESVDYIKALAECKYLINDLEFPEYFSKREGQVYLNTWSERAALPSLNTIRNFLSADYLLSSGTDMTRRYKEDAELDGLYNGRIIETGMPCEEGQAATRAVNTLFFNQFEEEESKTLVYPKRPRILFYMGHPTKKEQVYSLFGVLEEADITPYDITLLVPEGPTEAAAIKEVKPKIRILVQTEGHGRVGERDWDQEYRRWFGTAEFDQSIDAMSEEIQKSDAVYRTRIQKGLKKELVLERLGERYLILEGELRQNTCRIQKMIPLPEKPELSFIMLGPLTEENDPVQTVRALKQLLKQEEQARLYIVGDGERKKAAKEYAENQGITDAVLFLKELTNPYPLLSQCGCVILSKKETEYLQQEMHVLGKPVIWNTDAVYQEMRDYIQGKIKAVTWDEEEYKKVIQQQFWKMVSESERSNEDDGEER